MPKISDFQAILFDVDSTLNNSHKEITPATISALQQLPANFYQAVCTGRIFAALNQYAFQFFPTTSIHIICGGAQLVKTTGEVVWEKVIPGETAASLCSQLQTHHIEFLLSRDQKMFVTENWRIDLAKGSIPIQFGDTNTLTSWTTPLISIREVTKEVRTIIKQFPNLTVKEMANSHGSTYFDITAEGVNKASALDKWSELTGISLAKTIGVGDSSNDIEFLQKIGWPVAMGNAIPELKALAKRTIGNTDQDGLAVYLRQISQGAEL